MKKPSLLLVIIGLSLTIAMAQENCLNSNNLLKLDAQWEKALLESDYNFIKGILADDFIWVHNHAGMTDTKESLLKRASDPNAGASGKPRSRISRDVTVKILGSTAIVTGFTFVDRGPTPTNYHFMRTYTEVAGKCYLLANHTMAVPEGEE